MLSITEQEFDELYPDLKGCYSFYNYPVPAGTSREQFERVYLKSKLWRLNNLYTIVDKRGNAVRFCMNKAQHIVYAASRMHPRVIILKSRQQGISTFWLVSYFDDGCWQPLFNIGLMAQGVDEASTLLERTKFLWDHLDEDIKRYINLNLEKDNAKAFTLSNHSNIFIRVSFRSTTLQRLHVSEFGKIANHSPKKAKEVKTGTLQALAVGNTGVIESTAEGRNMFKEMWDSSVAALHSGQLAPKDFYPVFLSWLDDPDCVSDVYQLPTEESEKYFAELSEKTGRTTTIEQRNFWIIQRRELGADIFQEYPATPEEAFTAAKDGTYYSRTYMEDVVRKGRRVANLYDPNLYTDVYFDLGVDDYMVIAFVQWYRGDWRIVKEYWNNGYGIKHYLDIVMKSGWPIRSIKLPHDGAKRELTTSDSRGRAKSVAQIAREYIKECGYSIPVHVLEKGSLVEDIEAVRGMIPNMMIDTSCTYMHDCLLNYSKEFDDKLNVWKATPLHDEYSHGADVLRQIVIGGIAKESYNESRMAVTTRHRVPGGIAL